jgi:hypothetical protein
MTDRPFDAAALVAAFAAHDHAHNDGDGDSASPDSGRLGWGEARWLDAYVKLYDATADADWLARLVDHAHRIFAHRQDHFGDGGATWVTPSYSVARLEATGLHNRGTAVIEVHEDQTWISRGGEAVEAAEYLIDFAERRRFRILRLPARRVETEEAYRSGAEIEFLLPFRVALSGRPQPGDAFRVRTHPPAPVEYIVHQGNLLYPIARFIQRARRDKALAERFGADADILLDHASALAKRHERDWLDTGRDAGAYRFTPSHSERYPNRILPHNQYLALGRAFLVLADCCRRQRFADRSRRMARNFKRHLQRTGPWFVWHYWDWIENGVPGHSAVEDTSHGHIDVGFAVEACRRGVVFRPADLRRLAATLTGQMWNGSLETPTIGGRVDTREGSAATISDWIDLCEWDPRVWELYWSVFVHNGQPPKEIPTMLQGWARLRQGLAGSTRGEEAPCA